MRPMGGDSYLQRRGIEGLYATNVLNYYSGYWILSHLIIRNNIFLYFFNFLIPQVLSKKLEAQQEKLRELDGREVELHARIGECYWWFQTSIFQFHVYFRKNSVHTHRIEMV